ncbi:CRISPR-associated protein, TM1793 family [Rhodospirillum centenum SW]|uniref:CRISPR-associated protein, TM1793 family n=1 Tax=Rhodospirillum centenum (strain ATCC 51521 / SW) TaxID=414684 RepID=B6IX17_RHOCS|nr:CRISPR-associated protein, TM1793 family [Rhodospirillum centenum SW]
MILEPLDGLFFRGGKPFGAGTGATSGLPQPQTLAGALRTALMQRLNCNFGTLKSDLERGVPLDAALAGQGADLGAIADLSVRGPWLAKDGAPLLPAPLHLHREKHGQALHLLTPLRDDLPGWRETAAPEWERPLWAATEAVTEPAGGFITLKGMAEVLEGRPPAADTLWPGDCLYDIDRRVGLAIKGDTLTGEDGMLYGVGFLCLRKGVSFVAQIDGLTDALKDVLSTSEVIAWGGEGRRVRVGIKDGALPWPEPPDTPASDQGGTVLVLTTPAFLDGGWRGADWRPLAAAVRDPVPVSGWDLARRQPKPTRFAVPAGSVFFFAGDPPEDLALGPGTAEDRHLGYGCVLKGVWRHA